MAAINYPVVRRLLPPLTQVGLLLLGVRWFAPGVIEPRVGYYDHEHHRWYHEHRWREYSEHEEHCRG
jgi:hypothetical protein